MSQAPPSGRTPNFQMKIITAPESMPAIAPYLLQRFQNRANSTTGPKVAPKPAQAKETTRKMELLGFSAKNTATIAIQITPRRAINRFFLSSSFRPHTSCSRFCVMPEAAASSCTSAVDIVAERIPARMMPAIIAKKMFFWLIRAEARTRTDSASELLEKPSITPAFTMAKPTIPMITATPRETTTHVAAMRRLVVMFFSSLAAMKWIKM